MVKVSTPTPIRTMELITILNRCHRFRGFVYQQATSDMHNCSKQRRLTIIYPVKSLEQTLSVLLDWICSPWGVFFPDADRAMISRGELFGAHELAMALSRTERFETPVTE